MKVAIGVPCGEVARYSVFYDSLMNMRGVEPGSVIMGRSGNVAENRNGIAERAVERGYDAIFYADDDQLFSPDTLLQLMSHDVDVVSGLYVYRGLPFHPHFYDREHDGKVGPHLLKQGDGGLQEAVCVGAGCLLVKTDVFRKLAKPWWTLGQLDKVSWADDTDWCRRVRSAGFKIHCDLECWVGHNAVMTLWPHRLDDGSWATSGIIGNQQVCSWPAAHDEPGPQDNGHTQSPFVEVKV